MISRKSIRNANDIRNILIIIIRNANDIKNIVIIRNADDIKNIDVTKNINVINNNHVNLGSNFWTWRRLLAQNCNISSIVNLRNANAKMRRNGTAPQGSCNATHNISSPERAS